MALGPGLPEPRRAEVTVILLPAGLLRSALGPERPELRKLEMTVIPLPGGLLRLAPGPVLSVRLPMVKLMFLSHQLVQRACCLHSSYRMQIA